MKIPFVLKRSKPGVGRVDMGDLRRNEPLSASWGSDRGQPIDRYYIERFLSKHAADLRGRCLEAAEPRYTEQFGAGRITTTDVLHRDQGNPGATLVEDIAQPDRFPERAFTCVVLTQVLQYVFDLSRAVETLHRVLEPGGVLLATIPAISPIDQNDWDGPWLWTFTELAVARLFRTHFAAGNLTIETYGNLLAASAFLHGMAAGELEAKELDLVDGRYPMVIGVRAVK